MCVLHYYYNNKIDLRWVVCNIIKQLHLTEPDSDYVPLSFCLHDYLPFYPWARNINVPGGRVYQNIFFTFFCFSVIWIHKRKKVAYRYKSKFLCWGVACALGARPRYISLRSTVPIPNAAPGVLISFLNFQHHYT